MEKFVIKKTLSEKEIEKPNNIKIAIPEGNKSTKNVSNKVINFNNEIKKNSSEGTKKPPINSTNEEKQLNFKIQTDFERTGSKNIFKEVIKDNKVESKLIPKSKDKIPLQIIINKTKSDLKFPNSTKGAESKLLLDTNLSSSTGFKKDILFNTPKGLKKVTKK